MNLYKNILFIAAISISNISFADSVESYSYKYSGKYEQISIAVDKKGRVTGFHKEQLGDNFSCYFGFSGDLKDGQAIISVDDEGFKGRLRFEGNDLVLAIPEAMEIPGCDMILLPMIVQGIQYGPKVPANWIEIKIVPTNDVALRKEPKSDADVLESLKKWHVLGVLEEKNNWSKVSYYKLERVGDEIVRGFKEGWVETTSLNSVR